MVSYKIYAFNEDLNIIKKKLTEINYVDFLKKELEVSSDKNRKVKINTILAKIKNLNFNASTDKSEIGKFTLDYYYPIPGGRSVWIETECLLKKGASDSIMYFLYKEPLLLSFFNDFFISKIDSRNSLFKSIDFKNKKLIRLYNSLKKLVESTTKNTVSLQRIIAKNLEIEDIILEEGNFKGKDEEISSLLSLIKKNMVDLRVITFKFIFFEESESKLKKRITIRINYYGKVLIYGEHPNKVVIQVLNNLEQVIKDLS